MAGEFPLWNPYIFMGFPFLADIQVGALYLPNIIAFLFFDHFIISYNLLVIFHILLAEIGMYLFLREEGLERPAAFLGAFAFVFSAAVARKISFINMVEVISIIPMFLFVLSKYVKQPQWSQVFWGSFLVALMIFAGHPASIAYFLLITLSYLFGHLICNGGKKMASGFLLMLIFGGLLSMIQLLPFLHLLQQSARSGLELKEFYEGSMNFPHIWEALTSWRPDNIDTSLYGGILPLVALGLIWPMTKKAFGSLKIWIGILTFLCLFFILGENNPLYQYLQQIPVFGNIRTPGRYGLLLNMAMAVSIALIADTLLKKKKRWLSIIVVGISLLVIIDLSLYTSRSLPFFSKESVLEEYESDNLKILAAEMQKDELSFGEARALTSKTLPANTNLMSDIEYLHGYNPLVLKPYQDMFDYGYLFFRNPEYIYENHTLFSIFNLKYYLFPRKDTAEKQEFIEQNNFERQEISSNFILYRNKNTVPRIYSPEKIIFVDSLDTAKKTLLSEVFEPGKHATVEDPNASAGNSRTFEPVEIDNIDYRSQRIRFSTQGEKDGFVVVNDTWYTGWVASIDGEETPIYRSNGIVRGIYVTAGKHEIEFSYLPRDFKIGAYISLLTFLLLSVIVSSTHVIRRNKMSVNSSERLE